MTLGNHQPYFFPYLGYWQLMNATDVYVIADNVQYSKKGYTNRNNILMNGNKHLISLEVMGVRLGMHINEVGVGNNAPKILKTLMHTYKKAPYFDEVFPMLESILLNDEKNLAKYLGNSLETVADYLGIETRFIYESDLNVDPSLKLQTDIIPVICKMFNADHFINAIGGQELYTKEGFLEKGLKLNFLQMGEIEYKQFKGEFVPNLSIIDVMMFNTKDEIKEMLSRYTLI